MNDFEYISRYNGSRGTTGTVQNDMTTAFFWRCLYQRLVSVIKFTIPEVWNQDYFKNVLFTEGFIGLIKHDKYGWIPQICGLSGQGIFLQPTDIHVSQPLVNFTGKIGVNCELIKLTTDYTGVLDVVDHYAPMLAEAYTSVMASLKNSRMAYAMGAKNKASAQTLKIIAEKVSAGETAIVYDKLLEDDLNGESGIWNLLYNPKDSYILTDLLSDIDKILSMFDREVGIPSVGEKRERYISDEIEILTADSSSRLSTWEGCLTESFNKCNKISGLNLSFTSIGGGKNGIRKTDTDRAV